jgi:hypothetical protein
MKTVIDVATGKDVTVVTKFSQSGRIQFFRELTDGENWIPHPSGNGIIVAHPDRKPLWCRIDSETDTYRQDWLE